MTKRILLMLMLSAACDVEERSSNNDDETETPPCFVGWYTTGTLPCSLRCPGNEECDQPDCTLEPIVGLLTDNRSVQVSVTFSASLKSFSGADEPIHDEWSASSDSEIRITEDAEAATFVCDGDRLQVGAVSWRRTEPDVAAALADADASSDWNGVSF